MNIEQSFARMAADRLETSLRAAKRGVLKTVYDFGADSYDSLLVKSLGYRAHELAAEAFAAHWPGGSGPVVDLGCGTGLTALTLKARVAVEIDGLDFSPEMLERARRRGIYRRLVCADVTQPLPVPDGSYAGAISSGLFTHGHVGAEAFAPILAALKPEALFAFTVYSSIWRRGGFEATLQELAAQSRIAVLEHQEMHHFRRLKSQKVHVLAIRIGGGAEEP